MNRLFGTMIVALFCGTMLLTTSAQAGDRRGDGDRDRGHDRGYVDRDRGHDGGHDRDWDHDRDHRYYRPAYAPRYYAPVRACYGDYVAPVVTYYDDDCYYAPAPVVVVRERPVYVRRGFSIGFSWGH